MTVDGTALATRACELAEWQCPPEEIVAELGELSGWDDERVEAFVARFAGVLTRARLRARAELRGMIWRNARGKYRRREDDPARVDEDDVIGKEQWNIVLEVMRQNAGWSRTAPMDELMRFFLAAEKQRDKQGGSKLRVAG